MDSVNVCLWYSERQKPIKRGKSFVKNLASPSRVLTKGSGKMFWVPRRKTSQEWKHTSAKLLAPLWAVYVKQALTRAGENPFTHITPPLGFVSFSDSDWEGYSLHVDRSSDPIIWLQCSISRNPSFEVIKGGFEFLTSGKRWTFLVRLILNMFLLLFFKNSANFVKIQNAKRIRATKSIKLDVPYSEDETETSTLLNLIYIFGWPAFR